MNRETTTTTTAKNKKMQENNNFLSANCLPDLISGTGLGRLGEIYPYIFSDGSRRQKTPTAILEKQIRRALQDKPYGGLSHHTSVATKGGDGNNKVKPHWSQG